MDQDGSKHSQSVGEESLFSAEAVETAQPVVPLDGIIKEDAPAQTRINVPVHSAGSRFRPALSLLWLPALAVLTSLGLYLFLPASGGKVDSRAFGQAEAAGIEPVAERHSLKNSAAPVKSAASERSRGSLREQDYIPADIFFEEYDRDDFERILEEHRERQARKHEEKLRKKLLRKIKRAEDELRDLAEVTDEPEY